MTHTGRGWKVLVTSAMTLLTVLSPAVPPAQASTEKTPIDDPIAVLQKTAPEFLTGNADGVTTKASQEDLFGPDVHSLGQEAGTPKIISTFSPSDSAPPQTVSLYLDGTKRISAHSDSIMVATSDDADTARYVVDSPTGTRIITAYATPRTSYESKTTFSFRPNEHPVPGAHGSFYIEDDKGDVHGAITAPWSRDASGRSLPTTYRWKGNTLIQTVQVPKDASFPVVADPAWTYTWTAKIYTGSTRDVRGRMHTCFNCYFPVEGAPSSFPSPGQLLPLIIRPAPGLPGQNATCIFGAEHFIPNEYGPSGNTIDGDFAFYFTSGPGHVDGPGSMISFDFFGDKSAPGDPKAALLKMKFVVFANVTNDSPAGVPQPLYLIFAKNTWAKFLSNYTSAVTGVPGGEGQFWAWTN